MEKTSQRETDKCTIYSDSSSFEVGQRFKTKHSYIRIMAIAENYIMARNKGCVPFVDSIKEFSERLNKNCY